MANISISSEFHAQLKAYAAEHGMTMKGAVEKALKDLFHPAESSPEFVCPHAGQAHVSTPWDNAPKMEKITFGKNKKVEGYEDDEVSSLDATFSGNMNVAAALNRVAKLKKMMNR